jgi:hypothetical protein
MFAKTSATGWSMAGDACPHCGETETVIEGFQNPIVRASSLVGGPFIQLTPPTYLMRCGNCRHEERKHGIPGT